MIILLVVSLIAKLKYKSRSWEELQKEERENTLSLVEETEKAMGLRA